MKLLITKKPESTETFRRPLIPFRAGRDGFRALLEASGIISRGQVLLPAYVGWSPREGSGVFDPIRETGAKWRFYPLLEDLSIDLEALEGLIRDDVPSLLVLIHYFGYPAIGSERATQIVRKSGGMVIEDQAHSLLSDWIGGVTGRFGDASIYSFHKLLPTSWGGGLALSSRIAVEVVEALSAWPSRTDLPLDPLSYDLGKISRTRRKNALDLARMLEPLSSHLLPMYSKLPRCVVPHTFPVRVIRGCRDDLYQEMNDAGFGVVSLYHTMVEALDRSQFPTSFDLARCILNLPVHQDVPAGGLASMVDWLAEWVGRT